MKTAKKTIKTILALLPLMGVMILFLTSFNAKTETYLQHSKVSFSETGGQYPYLAFTNPSAPNAKIIGTMYSTEYNLTEATTSQIHIVTGSMVTLAKFANTLTNVIGIPLTYTLIPLWYAFYLFMIEFLFMITNIITFVPRKCSEFFGG